MNNSLTSIQIIGLIKQDALQEFILLFNNEQSFETNYRQANELIQHKCGSQILHLCAQYNAQNICKYILSNSVQLVRSKMIQNTILHFTFLFNRIKFSVVTRKTKRHFT